MNQPYVCLRWNGSAFLILWPLPFLTSLIVVYMILILHPMILRINLVVSFDTQKISFLQPVTSKFPTLMEVLPIVLRSWILILKMSRH
jgi:hypothetical protein